MHIPFDVFATQCLYIAVTVKIFTGLKVKRSQIANIPKIPKHESIDVRSKM